jgi:hypothetical protein
MTAVDAINVIRTRIGMPSVFSQFTINKDVFRPRIKNERNVELIFEGHYYFDIRRWTDTPALHTAGIYKVDIEKVPVSEVYPTGFKYSRLKLPAGSQTRWFNYMYFLPFPGDDNFRTQYFIPNEIW